MEGNGSEVRLVRCPKCENLLTELPDYAIYECGGCGAVLRANKQGSMSGDLSEKSSEGKEEGVPEKEKYVCEKNISLIDPSSSQTQDKVFVKAIIDQTSGVETMSLHHKQDNQDGDAVCFDGSHKLYSNGGFENRMHQNGHGTNANREFSTSSYPREGSSNHRSNFPHDFGVHKGVENLEHDRAELLRKIDELKIQLCSSSDAREKPKDIGPINEIKDDLSNVHNSYAPEGSCRANLLPFATDPCVLYPVYRDYKQGHALNMGNIYPPNRVVRSTYQQPHHDRLSGHNMGLNPNIFAPQNCVGSVNGPPCSCVRCHMNWQVRSGVQQTTLRSNHHLSSSAYGLHGQNLVSLRDFDFGNGSLNDGFQRMVVMAHGTKRICHARAGGVPLLACPSCFVLLNIPKNLTKGNKNGKKIRCGACSQLILVEIEKNGIAIVSPTKLRQVSTEGDVDYGEAVSEDVKTSDDFLKVNKKMFRACSDDEQSPDSVIIVRESSKSADLALKDDPLLQVDSKSTHPQQTEPDDDFADFVFSRCGMGSKSKRASRQNSVKDVTVVTEKEVVYGDVKVSEDMSEEEDQPMINEVSESFLGGLFRKGLKGLLRPSRSVEMSQINVFVNGQPLSNRVVKKTEKLAGPIHPGNYWYDYRAGFWGVMGQPCYGIIPPFIEEFNYSMPRNCGAGNTGVFVNGRELHKSDLDLLASRGLPTTRDKFYMIEISGRVVDEYTGEELDDLGKLAPTVEKVKHGFGMRPRVTAE